MSSLSENAIKHIALGYLKSFYRLRNRADNTATLTGLDMRGANNIIADGFLHYTEENGQVFSATFEATSQATQDEIRYRPRLWHAFWDGMVFTCFLLPTILAVAHISGHFPLVGEDFYLRLFYFFLTIPLWTGVYMLLFRRLPRYRYIFAIEQFKQYPANDQWIAYGYDVFAGLPEKFHNELMRQCTRYGFGLIEITAQRKPKLIMAPSRAENFVPKRKSFNFLPQGDWQKYLEGLTLGPWKKFKKWLNERLKPVQNQYFRWFPRTYYNQWSLMGLGLLALLFLVRIEYRRLPINFPSEKEYRRTTMEETEGNRPETEYFKVDAPIAGFYDTVFQPYQLKLNEEQFEELIQTDGSDHADSITLPPVRIMMALPGHEVALYYSCDRFNALDQTFYMVVDSVYQEQAAARRQLANLNERGLTASAVWPPCLGGTGRGFLVYLDEILQDSLQATQMRDSLQLQLDSLHRPLNIMEFLPITNPVN
ncbi:MAG: hypothetical protein AAFR36_01150 [Bacteroidota bacterium]